MLILDRFDLVSFVCVRARFKFLFAALRLTE